MNVFDLFPSPYLAASDFDGQEYILTISNVTVETLADGSQKPAVWFSESAKPLLLNKTNSLTIADRYSPMTESWHGRPLTLFPTTVDFRGRTVDCIRCPVPATVETDSEPETVADGCAAEGYRLVGQAGAGVLADYGAGPNHVLPTGGGARFQSGLAVTTFLRSPTWMTISEPGVIAGDAEDLARGEGLEAHARAAALRG